MKIIKQKSNGEIKILPDNICINLDEVILYNCKEVKYIPYIFTKSHKNKAPMF